MSILRRSAKPKLGVRCIFEITSSMFLIEKLGLILFETFVERLARYSQAEGGDGLVTV